MLKKANDRKFGEPYHYQNRTTCSLRLFVFSSTHQPYRQTKAPIQFLSRFVDKLQAHGYLNMARRVDTLQIELDKSLIRSND